MPFRLLILSLLPMFLMSRTGQAQETGSNEQQSRTPPPRPAPAGAIVPSLPANREAQERAIREALQKLAPEKRRQVLDAMKKVWTDDDVRAARDDLRRATENYRRTLRAAMEETDPEVRTTVRPLVDRLLKAGINPEAWAAKGSPPSPTPETTPTPDGPPRYLRMLGLVGDKAGSLTPEERRLLASVREQVMGDARVSEAAAGLAGADTPRARAQAMQALRRTAQAVAVELEPRLKPLLDRAAAPSRPNQ
ncbi:MAG: hypothetical protein ACKV19_04110 [Verrucomicrobiales bacterium]